MKGCFARPEAVHCRPEAEKPSGIISCEGPPEAALDGGAKKRSFAHPYLERCNHVE